MEPAFLPQPLLLKPIFFPRVWGGDRLGPLLHKAVPRIESGKDPIGEAWELSDHPHGRSTISGGAFDGLTFGELLRRHPREMCGVDVAPARYPLMIKYVDAAENLSIQVHPEDTQAAEENDRGKSECWFIVDCPPGAQVIHGLQPGVDEARLRRAVETDDFNDCLQWRPIRPGDFIGVTPGTVHAILAGTLVCEVQCTSDLTYRLWDYNRQPPRELHVEKALRAVRIARELRGSSSAGIGDEQCIHTGELPIGVWSTLLSNRYFSVRTIALSAGGAETGLPNEHGLVLSVVQGGGILDYSGTSVEIQLGQTWYLTPGDIRWRFVAGANGLRVLLSESMEFWINNRDPLQSDRPLRER